MDNRTVKEFVKLKADLKAQEKRIHRLEAQYQQLLNIKSTEMMEMVDAVVTEQLRTQNNPSDSLLTALTRELNY